MSEEPASESGDRDPVAGIDELAQRVEALEGAVDTLDDDLETMIEDVRTRVVQVKREADEKAAEDHEHPDTATAIDETRTAVADLEAAHERIAEEAAALDERLEAGFANYEDVLEYLVDATDEVEANLETVVDAVISLRERTTRIEARRAERTAADRLKERAQRHGVTSGKCEACGGGVEIGLLTAARCPHCEAALADIEPRGFLRAAVLRTGARPALEGPGATDEADLGDLGGGVERSAPTMEGPPAGDEVAASDAVEPTDPAGVSSREVESSDRPVDEVPGIGSAYAERLRRAGVGTVGELASADPDAVADEAEIAAGRVGTWVERARELDRPG